MAKILMFGNQKGGVGKTQVSIMTATALSQAPFNLKTCVVDIDNQKSVIRARSFDLRAYQTESAPFEVRAYTLPDARCRWAAHRPLRDREKSSARTTDRRRFDVGSRRLEAGRRYSPGVRTRRLV